MHKFLSQILNFHLIETAQLSATSRTKVGRVFSKEYYLQFFMKIMK